MDQLLIIGPPTPDLLPLRAEYEIASVDIGPGDPGAIAETVSRRMKPRTTLLARGTLAPAAMAATLDHLADIAGLILIEPTAFTQPAPGVDPALIERVRATYADPDVEEALDRGRGWRALTSGRPALTIHESAVGADHDGGWGVPNRWQVLPRVYAAVPTLVLVAGDAKGNGEEDSRIARGEPGFPSTSATLVRAGALRRTVYSDDEFAGAITTWRSALRIFDELEMQLLPAGWRRTLPPESWNGHADVTFGHEDGREVNIYALRESGIGMSGRIADDGERPPSVAAYFNMRRSGGLAYDVSVYERADLDPDHYTIDARTLFETPEEYALVEASMRALFDVGWVRDSPGDSRLPKNRTTRRPYIHPWTTMPLPEGHP